MLNGRIKIIFTLVLSLALSNLVFAAESFKEGVDYDKLDTPVRTSDAGKIEVLEFFWYGCPHCFEMESHLKEWLARIPDDVYFIRKPAVLNKSWEVHGRGYYVAQAQGILEESHGALFNAIHLDKKSIKTKEDLANFYKDFGLEPDKFLKLYNSFSVSSDVSESHAMARAFRILGVPTVIINGKYVTTGKKAKSYKRWMDIINYLVQLERQEKAAKSNP